MSQLVQFLPFSLSLRSKIASMCCLDTNGVINFIEWLYKWNIKTKWQRVEFRSACAAEWAINKSICCVRCAMDHFVTHSFLLLCLPRRHYLNGTKTPCNAEIYRGSVRAENIFKRGSVRWKIWFTSPSLLLLSGPRDYGGFPNSSFINVKESQLLLTELSSVFLH